MTDTRYRVEHRGRGGFVHAARPERELALPIERQSDGSFKIVLRDLELTDKEKARLVRSLRLWFGRSGRDGWSILE